MHEKTERFLAALRRAGISNEYEWSLGGFEELFDSVFKTRSWTPLSQSQKAALVVALVEAGFSLDEIRAMKLARGKIADDELLCGNWQLTWYCPSADKLVEKVERRFSGSTREE